MAEDFRVVNYYNLRIFTQIHTPFSRSWVLNQLRMTGNWNDNSGFFSKELSKDPSVEGVFMMQMSSDIGNILLGGGR